MTSEVRKVTISLPGDLLAYADRRARRLRISRSQVIGQALAEAQDAERLRLAAEGYAFYAGEAGQFAEASATAVAEAFSGWPGEENGDDRQTR
jgi:metal-responsive CopG/Arc/MetJ family transcriptional regulator